MNNPAILVVGASGKFAGHVVPALAQRGARVRGMVRMPRQEADVRRHGADESIVADVTDSTSLKRGFEGVERVFYIAPAFMPDEAKVGRRFVAQALAAGVKRIVFSSVIHPVIAGLVNHAAKAPVEEAILDSGIEYTFLHPALYFQNFAASWEKVVDTSVLAEPWSCETRFSWVDYRDVAEVAAIALTENRLLYGTFELAAAGWLNRHEIARLISDVLGREIRAARIDPAKLGEDAAPMRPMFEHYERVGLRGNPLMLRAILGREPRTLAAFFRELARQNTKETTS
jgi:uncharacterized protein YbjT (DUF2867 family)